MSADFSKTTTTSMMTAESIATKRRLSCVLFIIGIIALAFAGFQGYQGLIANDSRPLFSWLLGFGVFFSMSIGMLMLVMIFYLFGAGWPVIIRRQLEHALAALPWLAMIFLPLLAIVWFNTENVGIMWNWMDPENIIPGGHTVGHDPLYQWKEVFLNRNGFTVRAFIYFGVLIGLAAALRKFSFNMDNDGEAKWWTFGYRMSALGVPLTALVLTFAAFDWFMSLTYQWFSTMYGVWFFATSMRAGVCGTIIICYFLSHFGYLKGVYNQAHRHDMGCLVLTFTVFWAYITFSQYFLIYNANVPEETFWYTIRELNADWTRNTWWGVGLALIFGYFFIPFFYFLFYRNKILTNRIAIGALWILIFHTLDLYFNIMPTQLPADNVVGYTVRQFSVTFTDIAAIIGVGAICISAMLRSMLKTAPVPIRDPYILESLNYHE